MTMPSFFTRLPAQSLLRSNPIFFKIHCHQFSQAPQKPSLRSHFLKCPILGIDPAKKLPIENLLEVFLDSSNGLVCMGRPSITKQLVLWNPASNLWKYLPRSDADFPAAETASLGFGCSGGDGDGDFSVVRMFSKDTTTTVGVEVYSSQLDGWRIIDPGLNFMPLHPKNAAIVKGNPYWLVDLHEKPKTAGGADSRGALLRFDAKEKAFDEIVPIPRLQYHYQNHRATFIDWKGSLGMLVCDKKDGDWLEWIDVWAYGEDDVWRVDARIGPINLDVDHLMDCSKSGKIVGGCTNGKLFVYDSESEKGDGGGAVVSELERAEGCSVLVFPYEGSSAFVEGMVPLPAVANDHDKGKDDRFEEIDGFFVTSMDHRVGQIACYYHTTLMMGSSRDWPTLRVEVDGNIM